MIVDVRWRNTEVKFLLKSEGTGTNGGDEVAARFAMEGTCSSGRRWSVVGEVVKDLIFDIHRKDFVNVVGQVTTATPESAHLFATWNLCMAHMNKENESSAYDMVR